MFKLQTTSSSVITIENDPLPLIDWEKHKSDIKLEDTTTEVTGKVVSCDLQHYKKCIRISCNRKVNPILGDKHVTCSNCGSKMLVKTCKQSTKITLLLQQEGNDKEQLEATMFDNIINELFDTPPPHSDETVEDYFLEKDSIKIKINQKGVIIEVL